MTLRDFERVDEITARRKLRDDHRDRLQNLHLVLAVMAQCPVLHDEDAENPVAAQYRRAHQRMVDFLTGLGSIGKIWMGLRVRQGERSRRRGDHPDQTFADPQPRPVHGFGPQPLGGEQLQDLAGPQDVSRADLGDHLGGNDPHNSFEPLLRGARTRHYVAKSAQEAAGCADAASSFRHPRAPGSLARFRGTRAVACPLCGP